MTTAVVVAMSPGQVTIEFPDGRRLPAVNTLNQRLPPRSTVLVVEVEGAWRVIGRPR